MLPKAARTLSTSKCFSSVQRAKVRPCLLEKSKGAVSSNRLRRPSSGPHRGINRRENCTNAPAQHAELFSAGDGLELADGSRHVFHCVVVELQILVFRSGDTPVKEEYVIALAHHKLYKAMAGPQIEN